MKKKTFYTYKIYVELYVKKKFQSKMFSMSKYFKVSFSDSNFNCKIYNQSFSLFRLSKRVSTI